jgi:hypothetical protein
MSRRPTVAVVFGALLLALPAAAQAQSSTQAQSSKQALPAPAQAQSTQAQNKQAQSSKQTPALESGSPIDDQGSNYNYRSYVTRVLPSTPGVSLQVLEFADRLILTNHSGQTVTVLGYQGEPYGRVLANGTVQLNTRSPAYFLNQNFYGDVNVPASASASATPHWTVVDRTGRLEWHDHRIHWMSPVLPPQVKNKGKRTKIFNWQVPIQVGAQKAMVDGRLFWVPAGVSKAPTGAIVALVVLIVLGVLLVLLVRRRRSGAGPAAPTPGVVAGPVMSTSTARADEPERPAKEAW